MQNTLSSLFFDTSSFFLGLTHPSSRTYPVSRVRSFTFTLSSPCPLSLDVSKSLCLLVKGKLSHDSSSVTPHSLAQPGNSETRFFWTISAKKGTFLSPFTFQHLEWEELSEDGMICDSGGHEGTASPSAVLTDGVLLSWHLASIFPPLTRSTRVTRTLGPWLERYEDNEVFIAVKFNHITFVWGPWHGL